MTAAAAAWTFILEAGGLDAVTMQAVAGRVGVWAPSVYKRLPNRAALIAAIGAAADLRSVAAAFRAFAHANPRAYELLFMHLAPESRPPTERNALATASLLALAEQLVGPDRALDAARLLTASAHGFVSMEITGAFRLGGYVDEAYRYGVDVLVDALATGRRAATECSERP